MRHVAIALSVSTSLACSASELAQIRVCSVENFDAAAGSCKVDERDGTLTTREVICSLPVEGRAGDSAHGSFRYLDDEVHTFSETITTDEGTLNFRYALEGVSLLPGGAWLCDFTVGEDTRSATFNSGAATGPVLDIAVCPSVRTREEAQVAVCIVDESLQGFNDTSEITCSATLAGAKGRLVRSSLMRGGSLLEVTQGITPDMQITPYAKRFAAVNNTGFGAGNYTCRFRVDDEVAAEKDFILR